MLNSVFERAVRQIIHSGNLEVTLHDGHRFMAGNGQGRLIRVHLTDPALPRRIMADAELAVGEGYTDGTFVIEDDDLRGFLDMAIGNIWTGGSVWWQRRIKDARRYLRGFQQYNPMSRAKANVAHHYDLSAELYDLFLDADKQYSCAYFRHPDDTLDQAQAQKKAHIAAKLLIEPGMSVLDIGCGWGGMALTLARDHGARVVGVTLSEEQHKIATRRAAEAGLSDRVDFRLTDYREVTESFDRIVSVGMFEHVGAPHYREYFRKVHDRLKPDGVALIHTIGRSGPPGTTSSWVSKYIFPGGYVPALSEMSAAIEHEDLYATDIEIWRLHYAETLRHWHDRFVANEDRARALYDDRFCRMWRYYLLASELTFRHGKQVVFQAQLTHRKDAVPITRDYMAGMPQGTALHRAAE